MPQDSRFPNSSYIPSATIPLATSIEALPRVPLLSIYLRREEILSSIVTLILHHLGLRGMREQKVKQQSCTQRLYTTVRRSVGEYEAHGRPVRQGKCISEGSGESVNQLSAKRSRCIFEGEKVRTTDETDEEIRGQDEPQVKKVKSSPDVRLACPYYKRNPAKYSEIGSCCGPGWDNISRLK
jgi:hypothetical protein